MRQADAAVLAAAPEPLVEGVDFVESVLVVDAAVAESDLDSDFALGADAAVAAARLSVR